MAVGRIIIVNDRMQQDYRYELSEPAGRNFDPAFRPDVAQVRKHCTAGDLGCRRRQRQALLHWAYDSRRI